MPSRAVVGVSALAIAGAIVIAVVGVPKSDKPLKKSTELVIEISGGFAYVNTPAEQKLEIGYLNNVVLTEADSSGVMKEVCNVEQIGTELQVLRGDIDEAASDPTPTPEDRIFNLANAVVTFPALSSEGQTAATRSWPPPKLKPDNPKQAADWNLNFVPSIKDFNGKAIDPLWRKSKWLNGRVELRGGTIVGSLPTDPTARDTVFKYAHRTSSVQAASTDKTIYRVTVPDDKVELLVESQDPMAPAPSFKRLVIKSRGNKPVRLRLRGLHAMHSPPSYVNNQELTDFCAFNALLESPVPSSDWLRLYYVAPPFTPTASALASVADRPSPGYYCDGNWF